MIPGKTPIGAILKVNGHLLHAFLLGAGSWWLWPSSPKWWGLGLISIILGAAAFGKSIEAARAMFKLYAREREIARFTGTTRAPDPSDLAGQDALKKAGMIDE